MASFASINMRGVTLRSEKVNIGQSRATTVKGLVRPGAIRRQACVVVAAEEPKLNKYSSRITQPKSQGASQAMLYATGMNEDDMNKAQVRFVTEGWAASAAPREIASNSDIGLRLKSSVMATHGSKQLGPI
eukprot:9333022-Pyramimonas_sp.AAC.1